MNIFVVLAVVVIVLVIIIQFESVPYCFGADRTALGQLHRQLRERKENAPI